jgi:hypothetical protein
MYRDSESASLSLSISLMLLCLRQLDDIIIVSRPRRTKTHASSAGLDNRQHN